MDQLLFAECHSRRRKNEWDGIFVYFCDGFHGFHEPHDRDLKPGFCYRASKNVLRNNFMKFKNKQKQGFLCARFLPNRYFSQS